MILGRQSSESSQYGKQDFTVEPIEGLELADQLHDAVKYIRGHYQEAELPDLGENEEISSTLPADPNVRKARLKVIDKIVSKMYLDNAEGRISDDRLNRTVAALEQETRSLEAQLSEMDQPDQTDEIANNYRQFFNMVRGCTHIDTLTREDVTAFIDRIEIGEKIFPEGVNPLARKNPQFTQNIRIFYRFIGELPSVSLPA